MTIEEILVERITEAKKIMKEHELSEYSFAFAGSVYTIEKP